MHQVVLPKAFDHEPLAEILPISVSHALFEVSLVVGCLFLTLFLVIVEKSETIRFPIFEISLVEAAFLRSASENWIDGTFILLGFRVIG